MPTTLEGSYVCHPWHQHCHLHPITTSISASESFASSNHPRSKPMRPPSFRLLHMLSLPHMLNAFRTSSHQRVEWHATIDDIIFPTLDNQSPALAFATPIAPATFDTSRTGKATTVLS
ncbi:hypothetical protein D9619_009522 [Psilocybe cf. subviscida]|uniref:Uncharacterized protein n=1 Tax=Psilocybe cf. subviscida TaxID=2480587 RepID=A0A8H5BL31_9AGAR|nr:hypothetical protein D9619_009522 [Psilocybe cf. subviscida]